MIKRLISRHTDTFVQPNSVLAVAVLHRTCALSVKTLIDICKYTIHKVQLKVVLRSKITFIFSFDFETLFTKHSPSEILSLNFKKKTVYLNCNFPI